MNNNNEIGVLGEDIASRFLKNEGFQVVERNYRKKWGEIDIVARETKRENLSKKTIIHFIEVKSVSRETKEDVTHETSRNYRRPEDAVHPLKVKRLKRVIQSYLLEKNRGENLEWQFDIIAVFIDTKNKSSKVRFTQKLII